MKTRSANEYAMFALNRNGENIGLATTMTLNRVSGRRLQESITRKVKDLVAIAVRDRKSNVETCHCVPLANTG